MESNQRRVISLLVDNQSGVLARVSSLFCRRGFNIDSLTVSATNDPAVSRITVTITSDEKALQQLVLQTERLEVTRQVFVLDSEKSLEREEKRLRDYEKEARDAMIGMKSGAYAFCLYYYICGMNMEDTARITDRCERQVRRYKREIEKGDGKEETGA